MNTSGLIWTRAAELIFEATADMQRESALLSSVNERLRAELRYPVSQVTVNLIIDRLCAAGLVSVGFTGNERVVRRARWRKA